MFIMHFLFQLIHVKITTTFYFITDEQQTATFLFHFYISHTQGNYVNNQIITV